MALVLLHLMVCGRVDNNAQHHLIFILKARNFNVPGVSSKLVYLIKPKRYMNKCPICDRNDVLNIVLHLKTVHSANVNVWLVMFDHSIAAHV